jgi:ech hydrogenase subunit A
MILGPLAAGVGLLCLKPDHLRRILVVGVTLAICAGAVVLARLPAPAGVSVNHHAISGLMLVAEVIMALYLVGVGIRARQPLMVALVVAQTGLMVWFETRYAGELEAVNNLFVDKLSVIMALINGVLGGGICLYALGYMRAYHEVEHPEVTDRRPVFFSLLFVFMGAMFGIIFANNLLWFYFFWEVTTLCSFLLIGYTRKPEAIRNSLQALTVNLAGGLAFALAIVLFHRVSGRIELSALTHSSSTLAMLPVVLLCFAGLTKSAQLPFSGWLLGAMVAPTPVSALLHSSTMVKAGVYLVLRLAPLLAGSAAGIMVVLIGGMTFLVGSFAAVSARDAKKVLAYSTIANLGLIVLCGGIGTAEAVWAGVLLIIFHAVAKCLLFLCVGVVEHQLHSRDIEAMSGLILQAPRIAVMMLIGMAGMFLAPFGMLISKWAVLKAVVDAYPLLSAFIVFGSSATLFFWVKWMGKLLETVHPRHSSEKELDPGQSVTLYGLALATFATCLLFPFISSTFIEPYVESVFGQSVAMSHGNILIMTMMLLMVMLFPLSFLNCGRGVKVMDAYLGGANQAGSVRFRGFMGQSREVCLHNYYLPGFFNESLLFTWGVLTCTGALVVLLVSAIL